LILHHCILVCLRHRVGWRSSRHVVNIHSNGFPHADVAPTDLASQTSSLKSLLARLRELLVEADGCHPVAEGCGVVVAGAVAVTFDERRGSELLDTGAGGHEALAASYSA